jgi:putative transposase
MPSTHLNLNYHGIFSTKNRLPIILAPWRDRLHAYLGGTLREMNAVALDVGGVEDHVHLVFSLKATHCLADVMRDVKSISSRWVHDQGLDRNLSGRRNITRSP